MKGDGLPRITKWDVEDYMQWSTEMEIILRVAYLCSQLAIGHG